MEGNCSSYPSIGPVGFEGELQLKGEWNMVVLVVAGTKGKQPRLSMKKM
jgi:hypothetical protein